MSRYELGGVAIVGSPHLEILDALAYSITLFLGPGLVSLGDAPQASSSESTARPIAPRPNIDFVEVNGADLDLQPTGRAVGSGYGPKFGETDLAELSRRSGIGLNNLKEACGQLKSYRLHGGLLQKSIYDRTAGNYHYFTIVPEGSWSSLELGGKKRRLSLRHFVILTFHCTAMGPHRNRERTIQAIMDAGLWWQDIFKEVQSVLRHCVVCISNKEQPLISGHQRSREYDGPFRYLVIDFVGPISPPSLAGNRYMFTCACAWSGWYWALPSPDDTSGTAARLLFMWVICDLAGYPVCLGSDRAPGFVESVIKALADMFGIKQVIGSAYHPQSQSPVERPHREYNMLCKTFMEKFTDWDPLASIFKWTVITSAKVYNGSYTPYEVVTGLKPRSPLDAVLSTPSNVEKITTERYVEELVRYLKEVHKFVDTQHERIREQSQRAKFRELGPGRAMKVGDYCLVRKPMEQGVSWRLQSSNFDSVFQVAEVHGHGEEAKTYTLSDLHGNRDRLGFSQPVAADRLTPVEMLPLSAPSSDQKTELLVFDSGQERRAHVEAQSLDGKVYLRYEDDAEHLVCDELSQLIYRWL